MIILPTYNNMLLILSFRFKILLLEEWKTKHQIYLQSMQCQHYFVQHSTIWCKTLFFLTKKHRKKKQSRSSQNPIHLSDLPLLLSSRYLFLRMVLNWSRFYLFLILISLLSILYVGTPIFTCCGKFPGRHVLLYKWYQYHSGWCALVFVFLPFLKFFWEWLISCQSKFIFSFMKVNQNLHGDLKCVRRIRDIYFPSQTFFHRKMIT